MLQKVCIDEVLGAGIEPGNIVSWVINRRAKTRWGMCTKNPDGTCIIQIAARLIEDERISEQACKETMIHEILHTCKGCKGHTGLWLIYANIMNKKYGYHIKRTTSGEEKGGYEKAADGKKLNFIVMHPEAAAAISKHEKLRYFSPDVNQADEAHKWQYRLFHDLLVYLQKNGLIYAHVGKTE